MRGEQGDERQDEEDDVELEEDNVQDGSARAEKVAKATLAEVNEAMKI